MMLATQHAPGPDGWTVYAAVVATLAVVWQAWSWWRSRRPDLVVDASYSPATATGTDRYGNPTDHAPVIEARIHAGSQAVTVREAGIAPAGTLWHLRRKPVRFHVVSGDWMHQLPENVQAGSSIKLRLLDPLREGAILGKPHVVWVRVGTNRVIASDGFRVQG